MIISRWRYYTRTPIAEDPLPTLGKILLTRGGSREKYLGAMPPTKSRRRVGWSMGRNVPSPTDYGVWWASWAPPVGSRAETWLETHFGVLKATKALLFAPTCFEFVKQCFMLHWGQGRGLGVNCPPTQCRTALAANCPSRWVRRLSWLDELY